MKHLFLFLVSLCCVWLQACVQNKEVDMENLIQEKLALTQQYNHRPLFGAQLNKTGCKMIVEVEGGIDYRLTDNTGESIYVEVYFI